MQKFSTVAHISQTRGLFLEMKGITCTDQPHSDVYQTQMVISPHPTADKYIHS